VGAITTHVLDVATGQPAANVGVVLERRDRNEWKQIGRGETNADGRLRTLMPDSVALEPGQYRLIFETGKYFAAQSIPTLYPSVIIVFEAATGERHYHVPLLLSPFGYSTYRGS
jgi:5-hydroxyisourate hydrolase